MKNVFAQCVHQDAGCKSKRRGLGHGAFSDASRTRGFTLIDLLVVVGVVGILLVGALTLQPALVRQQRMTQNATQVRGIHQSLVTFGTAPGTGRPWPFPGVHSGTKTVYTNGTYTDFNGNGDLPSTRFAILLNGHFFTPEYLLNPADPVSVPAVLDPATNEYRGVHAGNHSFALMALTGTHNERSEWWQTLNSDAVVLADRAIGSAAKTSSVWSRDPGVGWHGHFARNDNAVAFAKSPTLSGTRYGSGTVNTADHLFADDPTADDAFLVHENATTGFSSR